MPNPVNPNGMAASTAAMRFWEQRQEVLANNMANANTDGFKGERVFAKLMAGAVPAVESGNDMSAGTLRKTGGTFDVALAGKGFFVVQTANGPRLTRSGAFALSSSGQLVTADGDAVLGVSHKGTQLEDARFSAKMMEHGEKITVATNGTVSVGDQVLGQLRVDATKPGTVLSHEAGALFAAPAGSTVTMDPTQVDIRQGYLEESNVNQITSMVEMITSTRNYTAVQKAIQALDGIRAVASSEIGKPV